MEAQKVTYYVSSTNRTGECGDFDPDKEREFESLESAITVFLAWREQAMSDFASDFKHGAVDDRLVRLQELVWDDLGGEGELEIVDTNDILTYRYTYADFLRDDFIQPIIDELPKSDGYTQNEYNNEAMQVVRDFLDERDK